MTMRPLPEGFARGSSARRRSHLARAPPHRIFLLENPIPAFESLCKNEILLFCISRASRRRAINRTIVKMCARAESEAAGQKAGTPSLEMQRRSICAPGGIRTPKSSFEGSRFIH
jgi:hypothetical protein